MPTEVGDASCGRPHQRARAARTGVRQRAREIERTLGGGLTGSGELTRPHQIGSVSPERGTVSERSDPLPTSSSYPKLLSTVTSGLRPRQEDSIESSTPEKRVGPYVCHHSTLRRDRSGDVAELVKKVDETLMPALSELPGFNGYYFVDAGNGIMSSSVSSTPRSRPTSRPASPPHGCASRSSRT